MMGLGIQQSLLENTPFVMLKKMCTQANIPGNKTNHSLRATAATEMFRCGVPEKIIQERKGHRSLEALQSYERFDEGQHKVVSALLAGKSKSSNSSNVIAKS